jgi:hypothetical protein
MMNTEEPRGFNAKKNLNPPPRNGYLWLPLEHLMAAEMFARNGFVYMPPEHPEVIALATYWGRTPGGISATLLNYAQSLDPVWYAERAKNPAKRFELELVQALRLRAAPRAVLSARTGAEWAWA